MTASLTHPSPPVCMENLTDDAFLGGKLQCLQPAKGYRAGFDAVFLAAVVQARAGETVLEAGSGTGIASLCLAAGVENLEIQGLEINPESVQLARENAKRNDFQQNVTFCEGDLAVSFKELERFGIVQNTFDHVFANPPFFAEKTAQASPYESKAKANRMGPEGLDKWLQFMTAVAKPRASLTVIHRAEALPELVQAFAGRAGNLKIFPLFPKANMPASRVIIQGIKGSRARSVLLPGQIMHQDNGDFFADVQAVLRDGRRFEI